MEALEKVKNELVNHLYGVDKSKLSMLDLRVYAETVKIVDEIARANKPDKLAELMSTMATCGFGAAYKPVDMKEDA